jgi:hypothetical protein
MLTREEKEREYRRLYDLVTDYMYSPNPPTGLELIYAELERLRAELKYIDINGGMPIDNETINR